MQLVSTYTPVGAFALGSVLFSFLPTSPPSNSSNTFAQGSRCHQKEAVFRYAQKPFYALVSGLLPLRHLIVCEQSSAAIRALTPLNFRSRFRTLFFPCDVPIPQVSRQRTARIRLLRAVRESSSSQKSFSLSAEPGATPSRVSPHAVFFVDLSTGLPPPISAHKRCIARNHAKPPHKMRTDLLRLKKMSICQSLNAFFTP